MGTPLGDFVRSRRDALAPSTVGIEVGPRRRVPGLRRSELADRAGISVEYLIRIEQGADRNPSPSVLAALADALALTATDRERLRHFAKIADGCPTNPPAAGVDEAVERVRSSVLALLDQLEPGIAIVTNRLGDVLAHTRGFDRLARPSGLLDPGRPNLTRFVFTDPRSRQAFPAWEEVADERAADLWIGPSAQRSVEFSNDLARRAGAPFADRLSGHAPPTGGALRWRHPEVGELRLIREVLELPAADGQQLVVFLPEDTRTAEAVGALLTPPAELRVVG